MHIIHDIYPASARLTQTFIREALATSRMPNLQPGRTCCWGYFAVLMKF